MAETTIEWTATVGSDGTIYPGFTFNPWIGCQHVSPGCLHCYAETLNHRWGKSNWGLKAERSVTSDNYWKQPLKWNEKARSMGVRLKVFCASMADVWEDRPELIEPRKRLMGLIWETTNLDWLILTKRPQNIVSMVQEQSPIMILDHGPSNDFAFRPNGKTFNCIRERIMPRNIWLGCSICTNDEIHTVWPEFQKAITALNPTVAFVSIEPMLTAMPDAYRMVQVTGGDRTVNWLIVGAESGPKARIMDPMWAEGILHDCKNAHTSIFIKQLCSKGKKIPYDQWPKHFQYREFPN